MNVGLLDLSKESYLRNTALFKKFKSLKTHKKMEKLITSILSYQQNCILCCE